MSIDAGTNQSGKSGGDAVGGMASAGSGSAAGDARGTGIATVINVDPIGTGIAAGGSSGSYSSAAGSVGGDVTDNSNIGSINISS